MNTASKIKREFKWNGDTAITVFFDEQAGEELIKTIQYLAEVLRNTFQNELTDVIPAYQSLTLFFDILKTDTDSIEQLLQQTIEKKLEEKI